jgi:hypothetical protein
MNDVMVGSDTNVTLDMYAGGLMQEMGLDFSSQETLAGLNKALTAGYVTDAAAMTGGRSLIVQSLENTLKVVTYQEKAIVLWKDIIKLPAYSTVEEYNVGAFLTETDMTGASIAGAGGIQPSGTDATYTRKVAMIKFMGTVRVISHVMTLVRSAHGDIVALEAKNGTLWLLKQMEIKLFDGNAFQETAEFDGIYWQVANGVSGITTPAAASEDVTIVAARKTNNFIDLRGRPMSEEAIEVAVNVAVENFGSPSDIYFSTKAQSDLQKSLFPKERVNLPQPTGGVVGYAVKQIMTQAGVINLKPDVFLNSYTTPRVKYLDSTAVGTAAYIPNQLLVSEAVSCAKNTGVGGNSLWPVDGLRHHYIVTASNRYGENVPCYLGGTTNTVAPAAIAAATDIYDLTFIATPATGTGVAWNLSSSVRINIYRSLPTTMTTAAAMLAAKAPFFLIASLPYDALVAGYMDGESAGSGGTTALHYYDCNETLPGTGNAYLVENNPMVMAFKQLAPLMKLPLATITAAIRFALLLYGVPVIYAPRKIVIMRNVAGI